MKDIPIDLEGGSNTLQNRFVVMISPTYKHIGRRHLNRSGLFNNYTSLWMLFGMLIIQVVVSPEISSNVYSLLF